jgi:hypothetical protein
MDESCEPTYEKVIMYIREDPTFLSLNHGHSFDKGLLICGRVGCGKTLLFKGLSDLMKIFKIRCEDREGYYRTFYSKSANVIVQEFSLNGFEIMRPFNPYNEEKDYGLINNHLFIDDLGTESLGFYYGAQRNVLGELLQIRYDNRNEYITHATSNLDPQALKSFYGERVFSRINEMFNYINMAGNDRRL